MPPVPPVPPVLPPASTGLDAHLEPSSVLLWWIPVGAGGRVVRRTSGWWEALDARRSGRPRQQLVHAALQIVDGSGRYVVEMAPVWSLPRSVERGVVRTGPVGARLLGRSRMFRYEVRCWLDGVIPDCAWAVAGPLLVSGSAQRAAQVRAAITSVPDLVWGRQDGASRDMWTSNSVVSWALVSAGLLGGSSSVTLGPPAGTWAPGWEAGIGRALRAGDPGEVG